MKKTRIRAILVSLVAVCLVCCSLWGCFLFEGADVDTEIDMTVGETVDLEKYLVNASEAGYKLTSSNTSSIQILSNCSVKAVGRGGATITAKPNSGSTKTIKINAEYVAPNSISLNCTGALFQNLGSTAPITFNAVLNDGASSSSRFYWYLNETRQIGTLSSFTLSAQNMEGEYQVKVVSQSNAALSCVKTLRVYQPFAAPVLSYQGENILEEGDGINASLVVFSAAENPDLYTEWLINGEVSEEGYNITEFSYTPQKAGRYLISARVNGEECVEPIEVFIKGVITPCGIDLDFNSEYPKVFLTWQNREETRFEAKVTKAGSTHTVSIDASKGKYDLSNYVTASTAFILDIKSMDYGDIYYASEYQSYQFDGVSAKALSYLQKQYLGGNFYMTSDDDVYEVFEYAVIFRPSAQGSKDGSEKSALSFYMGYTSALNASQMSNSFRDRLSITGSYSWQISGSLIKNREVTFTIVFYAAGAPEEQTGKKTPETPLLPAQHLSQTGYSGAFPVEAYPVSASQAVTSDQLYYTVMKGLKPYVEEDSAADRLYKKAQQIMAQIIDEDMTDIQIAAAVHDYLTFTVTYDYAVENEKKIANSVLLPAFYIEGVLDYGFAVCDGISKTYTLLCGMAGVPCVRVIGSASTGSGWGEHAWNKIYIEGEWYIADATWDISSKTISRKTYKMCSKDWFMLIDSDFYLTRLEKSGVYPASSQNPYNWFSKNDIYIYDDNNLAAQLSAIVADMQSNSLKTYDVCGSSYDYDFFTAEFMFSPTLKGTISSKITAALNSAKIYNHYVIVLNTTVIIAFK